MFLYQLSFNNPATPIAEGIMDLHHSIFFFLILILVPVLWMFFIILMNSVHLWAYPTKNHLMIFRQSYIYLTQLTHGTAIEIIWTITPALILMLIAVPSFSLLYSLDEVIDPKITVKVIGHQWYWSYEMPDDQNFDSYMLPIADLKIGDLRLLEVDNSLIVPIRTHIRFIVTALDVLHSFAVPALGIKIDAVPGRLNQVSAFIKREGIYYGQCSELCGVNHGFMPIKILGINL